MPPCFSQDELALAFALYLVGPPGEVPKTRAAVLHRLYPPSRIDHSGFIEPDGRLSRRWEDAVGEALVWLSSELPVVARLDLLRTFYDAALADDTLHLEGRTLVRAARLLGLRPDQFTKYVAGRYQADAIDLPLPE